MNRKRFPAPERVEGQPASLDRRLCAAAGEKFDLSTAGVIRRHVDGYFRVRPHDALRLTGALLSTEGLSGGNEAWRRQLTDEIYQHTKQSIRCEVGLLTWLTIFWRLYQLVRMLIEIYHAEPQQLGSLADVPATSMR